MILFEKLIQEGRRLMIRMEQQIKQGVLSLPQDESVIVREDSAWLAAAEALVNRTFGEKREESQGYQRAMQAEVERV